VIPKLVVFSFGLLPDGLHVWVVFDGQADHNRGRSSMMPEQCLMSARYTSFETALSTMAHSDRLAELETLNGLSGSLSAKLGEEKNAICLQLARIVYPILSLPPEITSEIFIRCLPGPSEETQNPHSSVVPLLLPEMCTERLREPFASPPPSWGHAAPGYGEDGFRSSNSSRKIG
jgi:hypothetical protein